MTFHVGKTRELEHSVWPQDVVGCKPRVDLSVSLEDDGTGTALSFGSFRSLGSAASRNVYGHIMINVNQQHL